MNYNKIRKMDISNGPGVRVSLFVQGCTFNCKNCFNPETHDFNEGNKFSLIQVNQILSLCKPDYIRGLSILGGEPLHPKNTEDVTTLCKYFKQEYPFKTIWVWSGFKFEDLVKRENNEIFNYIDVLIDGQFIEELYDPSLLYRGSSNQRVIDVQKTLQNKNDGVILYSK